MQGKIIKQISNDYVVKSGNKNYNCKARGKFRKMEISPLVGDEVDFDEKENYILKILPRKNELNRPRISNIDQAIIITSLKEPNFDTNLLDKLLCIISYNNIQPIIIRYLIHFLSLLNQQNSQAPITMPGILQT